MDYQEWNKRLAGYFFNTLKQDDDIYLFVDKEFFATEIAAHLGESAWIDFVKSCISHHPDGRADRTISEKALIESGKDWFIGGIPPHLGFLCLMVLAWTHDDERHASNYYGRLQSLLEECGQPKTVPYIDSQRFARTRPAWSRLAHWANKIKKGALGFFDDRSIGPDIHVGRPLCHALISAADRHRLRRLFSEKDVPVSFDRYSQREMHNYLSRHLRGRVSPSGFLRFQTYPEEFVRGACAVYESWQADSSSQASAFAVQLALCVQPTSINANQIRVQIHYRDENFPQAVVHAQLENDNGSGSIQVSFKRYQHGWSSNATIPERKQDLAVDADFIAGKRAVRLQGVSTVLKVRGTSDGVLYFERTSYGPCRQILKLQKSTPCFVLVNEFTLTASKFLKANQTCLTPERLAPEISGWKLFSSVGLIDLDGFSQSAEPPRIALRGGAKLFAKRPVYYPDCLPLIQCIDTPAGSELHLFEGGEGSFLKSYSTEDRLVKLSRADLGMAEQFTVDLVQNKKILDSVRFRIDTPVMAEGIPSNWPIETSGYFPFSPEILINGSVFHRGNETFILQENAKLIVSVEPPDVGWEMFLDDSVLEQETPWVISAASVATGDHVLSANWRGLKLLWRRFLAVDPPECLIAGPVDVASVGSEIGLQVFPCPEEGARFRVTGNQDLQIKITYSRTLWQIIHHPANAVTAFTIPPPDTATWPAQLDIYCYTACDRRLLGTSSVLLRRIPVPTLEIEGEKFSGENIYLGNRPISIRLESPLDEDAILSVRIGTSECAYKDGCYHIPAGLIGFRLPIRVFWGSCLLPHDGPVHVSIEEIPKISLRLVNGTKDVAERYFKGRLPSVQIVPFTDSVKTHGRLLLDVNSPLDWGESGLSSLPHNLPEGRHSIEVKWREYVLATETLEVVKSPNCRLVPERLPDLRNYYRTEPMPSLIVDTSTIPSNLVGYVRFFLDQSNDIFTAAPLTFEEGIICLDESQIKDGEVRVKAMLGEISIGNCTLKFLDSSWQRIGPTPGEFSDVNEEADWRPCWFLKKQGREIVALLDDWCPRVECSQCPHSKRTPFQQVSKWKESAKLSPKFASKLDKQQWDRFVQRRKDRR